PARAATRARDTVYITRFMLVAPGAREVSLVGDFNEWDHGATPLRRVASQGGTQGVWTIDVPLTAGRYAYSFLVDGQRWVADPARPRAIGADDFGSPNSAVTVGGGDT
ncbi:MAG TPA: isoamylase early set domain-containing protein, partial [Gemmatirosa sp.]